MVISPKAWHARLYRFTTELKSTLRWGYSSGYSHKADGTNLCHYMRTIVLHLPLVVAWNTIVCLTPLAALFGPYLFFPASTAAMAQGSIVALLAAVVGIGCLCVAISDWFENRRYRRYSMPKSENIVKTYLKAKKQRICPLVEIKESSNA